MIAEAISLSIIVGSGIHLSHFRIWRLSATLNPVVEGGAGLHTFISYHGGTVSHLPGGAGTQVVTAVGGDVALGVVVGVSDSVWVCAGVGVGIGIGVGVSAGLSVGVGVGVGLSVCAGDGLELRVAFVIGYDIDRTCLEGCGCEHFSGIFGPHVSIMCALIEASRPTPLVSAFLCPLLSNSIAATTVATVS